MFDYRLPPELSGAVQPVIDATPLLGAAVLKLLEWAADYYHHPIGEVFATAPPRLLREGRDIGALQPQWSITAEGAARPTSSGSWRCGGSGRRPHCLAALTAQPAGEGLGNHDVARGSARYRVGVSDPFGWSGGMGRRGAGRNSQKRQGSVVPEGFQVAVLGGLGLVNVGSGFQGCLHKTSYTNYSCLRGWFELPIRCPISAAET
jgi:hypothetical protein